VRQTIFTKKYVPELDNYYTFQTMWVMMVQ